MTATSIRGRGTARARHPSGGLARVLGRPPGRRSGRFLVLGSLAALLTLLGVVMVLSASSVNDLRLYDDAWHHLKRQLSWLFLGLAAMVTMMRIDYQRLRVWGVPLMVVSALLLGLVLVPGVGVRTNGSARWIDVGPVTFQPSEMAKFAVVVYMASLLSRPGSASAGTGSMLRWTLLVSGSVGALLMAEPDFGTTVIVGALTFSALFFAGIRFRTLGFLGVGGLSLMAGLSLSSGYRRQRLRGLFDPWTDPLNTGWQSIQSAIAISNGGLDGVGLGASRAKWGFLPFAHTDFIYAIVAEELGLIGAGLVLLGYLLIGLVGLSTAVRAPDAFGQLLAAGVTTWIVVQALINIGGVMGILPITGVPLPFVSSGGSSLVMTMGAFGVLLNVARQAR